MGPACRPPTADALAQPRGGSPTMPKETMTSRERWQAVLTRHKPDRIPTDYWATAEATTRIMRYLGCRTRRQMLTKLHVDYVVSVHPQYAGPRLPWNRDVF